ncbi:hypothetical protein [Curvibacter lanceolatus]|uniref:hypothetical protein n=1 Tax=Curvibacter lanceolatus TaxID=86182 RepID=UPI000372FA8F|nr:hypothetical protein [Curvibacter lanceolatus]
MTSEEKQQLADKALELRIQAQGHLMQVAMIYFELTGAPYYRTLADHYLADQNHLIGQRSPAQVQRMELAGGLA